MKVLIFLFLGIFGNNFRNKRQILPEFGNNVHQANQFQQLLPMILLMENDTKESDNSRLLLAMLMSNPNMIQVNHLECPI